MTYAKDRIKTLAATAVCCPRLLRERRELFSARLVSPETHLDFLLQLNDKAAGPDSVETRRWRNFSSKAFDM